MSDPHASSASTATSSQDWIVLTPEARTRAAEFVKNDHDNRSAVRIVFNAEGVPSLEVDRPRDGDRTFVQGPVKVIAVGALAEYVKGLRLDYRTVADGKAGFAFDGTFPASDPETGKKAHLAALEWEKGPPILSLGDFVKDQFRSHYGQVAFFLTVFTGLELGATILPIAKVALIALLMVLAVTKAVLVAFYFMHLRFEIGMWKKVVLIPPLILAAVLIFALFPDVGLFRRDPVRQVTPEKALEAARGEH